MQTSQLRCSLELHKEMGGTEHFLQSAVAADEQHLLAELPVSLRVKETLVSVISDIYRFNNSDFIYIIVSSQTF